MIGQKQNKQAILQWRIKKKMPRFTLISGEGERLELAKYIGEVLNSNIVIVGKSVEEVRQIIELAYKTTEITLYIFEDGDNMSNQSLNAILKVTEESPNNAYFSLLCESSINILDTIKSRATALNMQAYTQDELGELTDHKTILKYCTNPQQVRYYLDNTEEMLKTIKLAQYLVKNIKTLSGVQILRITESLKLKDDQQGYDPMFFIKVIELNIDVDVLKVKTLIGLAGLQIDCARALQNKSLNKQAIMDRYLLELRRILK